MRATLACLRDPSRAGSRREEALITDWVKSSIPKSTLLIENGKYDIKQYVSPGTAPVRRITSSARR